MTQTWTWLLEGALPVGHLIVLCGTYMLQCIGIRVLGIGGWLPRKVSLSWSSPEQETFVRGGKEGTRPRGQQVQGQEEARFSKDKVWVKQ